MPVYNGDSVVIKTAGGDDAITLSSDGVVADKFTGGIDIESYPHFLISWHVNFPSTSRSLLVLSLRRLPSQERRSFTNRYYQSILCQTGKASGVLMPTTVRCPCLEDIFLSLSSMDPTVHSRQCELEEGKYVYNITSAVGGEYASNVSGLLRHSAGNANRSAGS